MIGRRIIAVINAIETGLRAIAALCLAAMFALVTAQVVFRYTGLGVAAYTEELARYAMIWMALFASAVAVRDGGHIRIDFAPMALGALAPTLRRGLEWLLDAATLAIFLIIFWQGLDIVAFADAQRSDGLRVPMSWPYVAIPASFGFAALFATARLIWGERPA